MKLLSILLLSITISVSGMYAEEVPSGGEMMVDVLMVRPLGVVSLVAGLGFFIVSAPFALLSGEPTQAFKETSNRLVGYPFRFTFIRKVGRFPGYMEELELVED